MSIQSKELEQRFIDGFERMAPDAVTRKIIMHAIEVFSKKGFTGAKIKDIAASAAFSQGYVYLRFKSKDEIFTKIADLATEGAGQSVQYAARLEGTPFERIVWLTEAYLSPNSIAMQHWRFILLQIATSEAIPEEAKRISAEKMRKPIEHLVPMIIEGQKAGEIVEGDPITLAVTYFSFIQGLAITNIQTAGQAPMPSVELVLTFLKKG
ncbi:TetR/AcrR family transcriptional regulator [Paenibacillus sp. NEAU-GSW1]|uniref:TetR/AcrR family transcriptional regulator n=1 Tax=Paenibacillus sp. NEAU-GSW1 TaxID=2682486 RepID=UPI0012E18B92|nr:TetR/AcrR family transcriptional regulator [Paenibacillus sp. NEAU-GSW1]MUT68319.1 TetR family transcriptional regulator [Paenibacillus sp. NEAU-GSW1]